MTASTTPENYTTLTDVTYFTEQQVSELIDHGALVRVLTGWCPPFAGYHLYYPSRRQPSAAFAVLVEALRYRPARGEQRLDQRKPPPIDC